MPSNACDFILKYEGSALSNGTMDATQLAPALLALSAALSAMNGLANKDDAHVTLQVKATERGSFVIDFQLTQDILAQVGALFTGVGIASYCNAYTILRSFLDLLSLKQRLCGKRPDRVEVSEDHSTVVYYVDNRKIETNFLTYQAFQSAEVTESAVKVAEPLRGSGIDSVTIEEGQNGIKITKSDLDALATFPDDIVISSDTVKRAVVIETAAFKDRKAKWRVRLGERESVFVTIADEQFLQRIDFGEERFGKGDVLLVEMEEVQTLSVGKINIAYTIKKVIEHKTSAEQLSLF